MTKVSSAVKDWIRNHETIIFPLLAFIIPLAVRTIPEILMGPYVVGFDTIGYYIPNALLWLHNGINFWNFIATAPLFYAIYVPLVSAGGSPVFLIKIISPLLLGFLGLSIYSYAKRGLNWSLAKSAFVAVLGTVYFVALRASWDQLREELGLAFFFIVLMLLADRKNNSRKHYVLLSLATILTVLSHQLVAVLMFGVIIFTVAYSLLRKDFKRSINLIVASLPAALYFVVVYIGGILRSNILGYSNAVSPLTGFASYQPLLINAGEFFLYCFLPLLPIAVIGFLRFRNLQLDTWLLLSFILVFIPLSSVNPYRWILLLTYPFAFYATDALSKLKSIKWARFRLIVFRIAILYLVLSTAILSFGFLLTTAEKPFIYFNPQYFNGYSYEIPTSMLQNTISLADCRDTSLALQWFEGNMNSSAVLLTHTVFYGWALLTLNKSQVVDYGFGDPVSAAALAVQEGHIQVYLVWWINGKGWEGQPTVASSFHQIHQIGDIAIYQYVAN